MSAHRPSPLHHVYVAGVAVLLLFPLAIVVAVSFDPGDYIVFPPSGFSARWYIEMWSNETIVLGLKNSLLVGGLSSVLAAVVAVPSAVAINSGGWITEQVVYPFLLSPFTIPWLVYGLALLFFWSLTGLKLSLATILIGHTVIAVPYVLRVTLAVLRDMPADLARAARLCGATPLQVHVYVTLPYVKSGVVAGMSFAFMVSFTNVPVSLFATTADNITLPVAIFNYMISDFEPIVATASVVQVLLIAVVVLILQAAGRKNA